MSAAVERSPGYWAVTFGVLVAWLVLCLVVGGACGCVPPKGAEPPARSAARGAVLTIARAVVVADELCAATALETRNVELARACVRGYEVARPALLAAESTIDAWDGIQGGQIACSVRQAVVALGDMAKALRAAGVAPPPVVDDAAELGASLGRLCGVPT